MITATILDPMYKKLSFLKEDPELKVSYQNIAAQRIKDQDKDLSMIQIETKKIANQQKVKFSESESEENVKCFSTALKEIKAYVKYEKNKITNFYQKHSETFPRLSQCVELFLLSPATSVPCERLFSHASFQVLSNYDK